MMKRIDELISRIKELENELSLELENELSNIQQQFRYRVERGKIRFQEGALATHKALKENVYHYFSDSNFLFVLTSPVIFSLTLPLFLLDLVLTLYQFICFPVYKIKKVKRSEYVIVDRQHLAYLNMIEKANCIYCGYANGLLSYALEIGSKTEEFWCPIKHAKKTRDPHSRYHSFLEYGDAEGYKNKLSAFRKKQ
jgi:hypothetical protein